MKNALCLSALLCAALLLSAPRAQAFNEDRENVRMTQMHLASLGYYVGPYDGIMGTKTENALSEFQTDNGLYANGHITADTLAMLDNNIRGAHRPMHYANYYNANYYDHYNTYDPYFYNGYENVAFHSILSWDDRWHWSNAQSLPTRFGTLALTEEDRGGLRYYAVVFNGQPVFFADNQPGILRVSKTFSLRNEDAVILTAYHGDGVCAYKSYLLVVHNNGTYTPPREIGTCNGGYDTRVTDDSALLVNFRSDSSFNGWASWDTWRYQNDNLVRL